MCHQKVRILNNLVPKTFRALDPEPQRVILIILGPRPLKAIHSVILRLWEEIAVLLWEIITNNPMYYWYAQ